MTRFVVSLSVLLVLATLAEATPPPDWSSLFDGVWRMEASTPISTEPNTGTFASCFLNAQGSPGPTADSPEEGTG